MFVRLKLIVLFLSVVLVMSFVWGITAETVATANLYLLVGSYAAPSEEGIRVYRFNEDTGASHYISGLKGLSNPSYLIPSEDGSRVYAVGEDEDDRASACALSFEKETGELALLNAQPTQGGAPCYIVLDPSGQFVITANYLGGSMTVFPLGNKGELGADSKRVSFSGQGSVAGRQSQSHVHCIAFTPDRNYLLATDLGTDHIYVFPAGALSSISAGTKLRDVKVEPGSGPRHICFHPNGQYAYLINEISGKVTAFAYADGKLDAIQYIAADSLNAQGSGDIHISPDGKYLYASNRLQGDGLAVFAINGTNGMLTKVAYQPTALHPRNFIITPNGNYLLVACRDSNTIQLFKRNKETGLLQDTGQTIQTNKPVCLKFIP